MKLFAVQQHTDDGDEIMSLLFRRVFRLRDEAEHAVREDFAETLEALSDGNETSGFKLVVGEDGNFYVEQSQWPDWSMSWEITEVELD